MNIIIKKNLLLYKDYKLKCCIGKSGITNSKKEGDLTTPKGLFKLGSLYYRKDRNKFLKSKLKKKSEELSLTNLSMGMSADYEHAILNGSTYLRLGTIILGERNLLTD